MIVIIIKMNLSIVFLTIIFTSFGFAASDSNADFYGDLEKSFKEKPTFKDWHVKADPDGPETVILDGQEYSCILVRLINEKEKQEKIGYYFDCLSTRNPRRSVVGVFPENYLPASVEANCEFTIKSTDDNRLQVIIFGSTSPSTHQISVWQVRIDNNNPAYLQYSKILSNPILESFMLSVSDLLLYSFKKDDNEPGQTIATIEDIEGKKPSFSLGATHPIYYLSIENRLYRWYFRANAQNKNAVKVLQDTTSRILSAGHIFTTEDLVTLEYFDHETRTFKATNFGPFRFDEINNVDPDADDFVFDPQNPLSVLAFRDTFFGDSKWKFLSARLERNVFRARLLIAHFLGNKFSYPFQYDLCGISHKDGDLGILELAFRFPFGSTGVVTANLKCKSIEFSGEMLREENYLSADFTNAVGRLTSSISYVSDLLQEVRYAQADDGYMVPYIVLARQKFHRSLQSLRNASTMLWVEGGPESTFIKTDVYSPIISVLNSGGVVIVSRERGRTDCGFLHLNIGSNKRRTIDDGKSIIWDLSNTGLVGNKLLVNGGSFGGTFGAEVMFAQDLPKDLRFSVIAECPYLGDRPDREICETPYKLDDSTKNSSVVKAVFTHGKYDEVCPIEPVRVLTAKHSIEFIEHNAGHDSLAASEEGAEFFKGIWKEFCNPANTAMQAN